MPAPKHVPAIGERFNALVVVDSSRVNGRWQWQCRCDCGRTCWLMASRVRVGLAKSCPACARNLLTPELVAKIAGLYRMGVAPKDIAPLVSRHLQSVYNALVEAGLRETRAQVVNIRGISKTPEWVSWRAMQKRCYSEKHPSYAQYGGRGITVHPSWHGKEGLLRFIEHVGKRPSPEHSLDRYPDANGNYEPGNVRWATKTEQARNTRTNRLVTIGDRTQPLVAWCDERGIKYHRAYQRLRNGWTPERALEIST